MRRGVLALGLITMLVGLGWVSPAVQAQPATAPPAVTTTSELMFQNTTTTSTTVPKAATTTTVARATTTTTTKAGSKPAAPSTTTTTAAPVSPAANAAMVALANSVVRTPAMNDQALLAALAPLEKLGYTTEQAEVAGMGQFPIAGPADYTDDWLEYRSTPTPHNHEGIDIDAALGTPIRAPVAGTLNYDTTDPDGYGLAADVTGADKTEYVMAHMSATVTGLHSGSTVTQGQIIGFVGDSGDATGPHCHFEVHPGGGAGINAMPILNAWLTTAIQALPALITSLEPTSSTSSTAVGPLQLALPANSGAIPHSLAITLAKPKTAAGSMAGLGLVALLALLAASSLSFVRFRPWPLKAVVRSGPDGPPADLPTPVR